MHVFLVVLMIISNICSVSIIGFINDLFKFKDNCIGGGSILNIEY